MRNLSLALILAAFLTGCFESGEPPEDTRGKPPKSLDPISTPIYAGEAAKAKIARAEMYKAIQAFQEAEGRFPTTPEEIVEKKYLSSLPKKPAGMEFTYDPATGVFDVVPKADLPHTSVPTPQAPAQTETKP